MAQEITVAREGNVNPINAVRNNAQESHQDDGWVEQYVSRVKKKFGEGTDFEVATVDGAKVVHRRNEDEIVYAGKQYLRFRKGRTSIWNSTSDE